MVGVALNVTLIPEQILVADAATATDGITVVFTVIDIGVAVALVGVAHDSDEVITQVIMSPLARAALVYDGLLVPTSEPLSFH